MSQEAPWGMQIVVRYDKVHPPRKVDVAEASARAAVTLLAHPLCEPGGPWHEAVEHWRDTAIRKLVRRARGRRWEEVQELAGVTLTQDGPQGWGQAAARALPPAPVRPLPAQLAKTQVEGTFFPDGDTLAPSPARMSQPGPEGTVGAGVVLGSASMSTHALVEIGVTPEHEMSAGKLCAQVAHAAQLAWESPAMSEATRQAWRDQGYAVRVMWPSPQEWASETWRVRVVDAGLTELDGPTHTTRARW